MSDQQEQETVESVVDESVTPHDIEKIEEAKLKAKYGGVGGAAPNRLMGGHSAFLQKRLKNQKYFDSGDYQMEKQKSGSLNKAMKPPFPLPNPVNRFATGEVIPTPETVPVRKTSIIQPSKLTSNVS